MTTPTLTYPLTQAQYNTIVAYLVKVDPKGWQSVSATKKDFPFGNSTDETSLIESYQWYLAHPGQVAPKPSGNGPYIPGEIPFIGNNGQGSIIGAVPGVNSLASGISSVAGFISAITSTAVLIRIAEVAIGLILVAIGAAKLSGAANTIVKMTPVGKLI
jgi:hypothetical protein